MTNAQITELLQRWRAGDKQAESALLEAVYDELYRMVRGFRRRELEGTTKQTTELLNELYIGLASDRNPPDWESRRHFFGIAARQLRQVLVDQARARRSGKRGGDVVRFAFDMDLLGRTATPVTIIDLHAALDELERLDETQVRLVEMIFFAGMKRKEVAELLGISEITVRRQFNIAKAWLRHRLETGRALTLGAVSAADRSREDCSDPDP